MKQSFQEIEVILKKETKIYSVHWRSVHSIYGVFGSGQDECVNFYNEDDANEFKEALKDAYKFLRFDNKKDYSDNHIKVTIEEKEINEIKKEELVEQPKVEPSKTKPTFKEKIFKKFYN